MNFRSILSIMLLLPALTLSSRAASSTANAPRGKSALEMIRNLVDIASKGGNYLRDAGPATAGSSPAVNAERIKAVGAWMKVNGEAIHGTMASPFKCLPWGRCTQKPGLLYLHVFDWPRDGKLLVPGLKNKVTGAYRLGDAKQTPLRAVAADEVVTLDVGPRATDPIDTVIVVKIEGQPDVETSLVLQAGDGAALFRAECAELHGKVIRLETKGNTATIDNWTDPADFVRWKLKVSKPGTYELELDYACADDSAGTEYTVDLGKEANVLKVAGTGGWDKFATQKIGTVTLGRTGPLKVMVRAAGKPKAAVMNLRALRLMPMKQGQAGAM